MIRTSIVLWLLLAAPAFAAEGDWPCEQALVPNISGAQMWAGPSLDDPAAQNWQSDPDSATLVAQLSDRKFDVENDAGSLLDTFAAAHTKDKNIALTRVFIGTAQTINDQRHKLIEGLQRLGEKQRELGERIAATNTGIDQLSKDPSDEAQAKRKALEEQRYWDTRIYDSHRRSTSALCDEPTLLEQKLFALAREIMQRLDV